MTCFAEILTTKPREKFWEKREKKEKEEEEGNVMPRKIWVYDP